MNCRIVKHWLLTSSVIRGMCVPHTKKNKFPKFVQLWVSVTVGHGPTQIPDHIILQNTPLNFDIKSIVCFQCLNKLKTQLPCLLNFYIWEDDSVVLVSYYCFTGEMTKQVRSLHIHAALYSCCILVINVFGLMWHWRLPNSLNNVNWCSIFPLGHLLVERRV